MSLDKAYLAALEQQKGLPKGILAPQIQQESAFNPNAVSNKGAAGIMQIMPATARDPGYGVKPLQNWDGIDPRTAPVEEQIRFGTDYMAAMHNKFGGDISKTLAAYNAGPGAVESAGGVPNFRETQDYVDKITGNMPTTQQRGGPVVLTRDQQPYEAQIEGMFPAGISPGMVEDTTRGIDPQMYQKMTAQYQPMNNITQEQVPIGDIDAEIAQLEAELGGGGNIDDEIAQLEKELGIGVREDGMPMPGYDPTTQPTDVRPEDFNPEFFGPGIPIPMNADALAFIGQTLGRGAVADVVGAPVDLLNLGLAGTNSVTDLFRDQDTAPVNFDTMSSDSIADIFGGLAKQAGYPVQNPDTLEGDLKYGYNMGRFGASGGLGGISMAARANRLKNAGKEAGFLTKQYMDAPVKQVVDDTIANMGAGAGSTAAQEAFPDSPLAQITGTMLGSGTASVGSRGTVDVAKAPFKKAESSLPVKLPDGTTESRRTVRDSARLMQVLATDPEKASANIKVSNKMADEGGLTRMTSGAAADDVGLGAAEVKLRTQDPVTYQERDQKIRTDVSKSVADLSDPNADIEAPQRVARGERDRQITEATAVEDAAQRDLTAAEQKGVDIDRETEAMVEPVRQQRGRGAEASKQLDEQVGGALDERTKVKNKAFDEAAGDTIVDAEPIRETVKAVKDRVNKLGGMGQESGLPGDFVARVEKLADAGEGVPLKDVSSIRKNITSSIARAKQAGNFDLVDDLSALKKDINRFVDEEVSFEVAQKYYREEYAPFFAEGYGKKYRDTVQKSVDRTGTADPGRVAEIFLNGTPDAAADLKRIVDIAPDSKAAEAAVERYMAADLASKIGTNASPRTIANWIKNRSAQLDQFPAVKKKFQSLQNKVGAQEAAKDALRVEIDQMGLALKRAEKNVLQTERRINKGILGTLIDADPDRYVAKIMSGDDRLQKLDEVNKLIGNNKQAKDGLKRAVTEYLMDTLTGTNVKMTDNIEGPIQYAQIAKLMKKNEKALAKVYDDKEMNALRRAQSMLSKYGNLARRGNIGSDTAEKIKRENLVTALETGLRVKYGVLKTGGIMRTIKGAARILPEGRIAKSERVVAQAMLDPELAVMLLDTPVNQVGTAKWNNKLSFLISGAAAGREVEGEEEE